MKKITMLIALVILLTSWTYSEKFQSFTLSNKYVCLPYEQMDKLIVSHKLVKNYEAQNIILTNQIRIFEDDKLFYKKRLTKSFIYGTCAGVGATTIIFIVIVARSLF